MPDWPNPQGYNQVTITTTSPECLGAEMGMLGTAPSSQTWFIANASLYLPFVVSRPFTARTMGVVNGSAVSGNVDVGIYDDQMNRLVSKGSTAQSGTVNAQTFDITDTLLNPGVYFMALVFDNAVATTYRFPATLAYASAYGVNGQLTAFPLPATATPVLTSAVGIPNMLVSSRTII